MSQNQIRNLEDKLDCRDERIRDLKEKLRLYDEEMVAKDVLQKKFNELQRWVEEATVKHNKINDEQLNTIESLRKSIEESELAIASFRSDNNKLTDINGSLKEQLKTLHHNEEKIIADVKKLETLNENLENDLCNLKVSLTTFIHCYFV